MEDKILLTANDILEKEFKIDARGYRPQEVDKFLDIIIKDYTEYEKIISRYNAELTQMVMRILDLRVNLEILRVRLVLLKIVVELPMLIF